MAAPSKFSEEMINFTCMMSQHCRLNWARGWFIVICNALICSTTANVSIFVLSCFRKPRILSALAVCDSSIFQSSYYYGVLAPLNATKTSYYTRVLLEFKAKPTINSDHHVPQVSKVHKSKCWCIEHRQARRIRYLLADVPGRIISLACQHQCTVLPVMYS